jgi:hypothetical protein
VPGAPHAGAWRTKNFILTINYEPKSRSRRTSDQFDEKIVIVRGALMCITVTPNANRTDFCKSSLFLQNFTFFAGPLLLD